MDDNEIRTRIHKLYMYVIYNLDGRLGLSFENWLKTATNLEKIKVINKGEEKIQDFLFTIIDYEHRSISS